MSEAATRPPIPLATLRQPAVLVACGFGAGLSPVAPGTAGTVVGVFGYLLLAQLPLGAYLAVLVVAFLVGLWACDRAGKALGVEDHPGIVWDEIVGFLVTMAGTPPGWQSLVAGFVLFRLFDILKPWPVSTLERRLRGGLGVMLDDVMAGIYALVSLQVLRTVFMFP